MLQKIRVRSLVVLLALSVALSAGAACGADESAPQELASQEDEARENQENSGNGGDEEDAPNGETFNGGPNGDDGGEGDGGEGDDCGFSYNGSYGEVVSTGGYIFFINDTPDGQQSRIHLEFREAAGGPDGPGIYDLNETDLGNCAICLVYGEYNSAGRAKALFAAQSGWLIIEEYDGRGPFKATLEEVEFVEIDFGGNGTVVIPNGRTRCLDDFSIDSLLHGGGFEELVCTEQGVHKGFHAEIVQGLFDSGLFHIRAMTPYDAMAQSIDVLNVMLYLEYLHGVEYEEGDRLEVDDINFPSCDECVVLFQGCDSDNMCQARYHAGAGEIIIERLDRSTGEVKLVLRDLQLVRVYEDDDGKWVIIAESGWCIDELVLETTF